MSLSLLRSTLLNSKQSTGTGNFRPAEDIIEEAANTLVDASTASAAEAGPSLSMHDVLHLSSLSCVVAAMRRICECKGRLFATEYQKYSAHALVEITDDMTVYRYSPERVQIYLRSKVARLSQGNISETSRTLTRSLAKDGLLEDGKEALLTSTWSVT